MKRTTLYSTSSRARPARAATPPPSVAPARETPAQADASAAAARPGRLRRWWRRGEKPLLVGAGALVVLGLVLAHGAMAPKPQVLTQDDIDNAVRHTLETKPLPSWAAKAYDIVRPAVVKVRDYEAGEDGREDIERGVGTGVVIVDKGIILTNLHVVAAAKKVGVVFADGTESDASVLSVQPENDLAVLRAKTIPDDLSAATMRSTGDLAPGDHVVAVGFPFGIGPSVSAGVVSGLKRQFKSPDGQQMLTNLIQFDAAANPGNSGGPLVTMEGEVVGIVTAILNPSRQRVFIGIGFAVPIENAAAAAGLSPF